eukprot:1027254-Prorocentrum_minimum.AAC.3
MVPDDSTAVKGQEGTGADDGTYVGEALTVIHNGGNEIEAERIRQKHVPYRCACQECVCQCAGPRRCQCGRYAGASVDVTRVLVWTLRVSLWSGKSQWDVGSTVGRS